MHNFIKVKDLDDGVKKFLIFPILYLQTKNKKYWYHRGEIW